MAKKYLVTGGSGFIGSALVEALLKKGYEVRILDNNSRGALRRLSSVKSDIDFIEGDIRDPDITSLAASGVDGICHLAYVNGTEFFYSRPHEVLDVAVRGMLNVMDACRLNGVGELILASSSEVYQAPSVTPTPENIGLIVPDVSNPRYSYGGGKILSELMAIHSSPELLERVVIFRPHNVYGPDMGWEHVIPQFALRANGLLANSKKGLQFSIKGNGQQTRSFIYIDDFIEGLMRVISYGENRAIYHIGTMEEITILKLARLVLECVGLDASIVTDLEAPVGETKRRCPDIAKLLSLGFAPSVPLVEGLRSTISWYVENEGLKPASI